MNRASPNALRLEKSPYLLQHAYNPVSWQAWNEAALRKARNDNKPILLSIGYSTCHWCHVMAHESFEDEKTASFINKHFIPIKVDREERPELDAYYMSAVQAMTGGGGWPLTVFLTPDLKPFYGGTYFPAEQKHGMPSFMQVLEFVAKVWKDRRGEITENSKQVAEAIAQEREKEQTPLSAGMVDEGYSTLVASFDPEHGGFGGAPKFPLPLTSGFLLRYHLRKGKELALRSVTKTLDEMMAGGIRDHVGGGFHRYSTDRLWLVPHFEKMLYDNALLARLYTEAFQVTGKTEYAEVAKETIQWLLAEMKDEGGGFYSAQDADTEEGEGAYYTWTPEEILTTVGKEDGATMNRVFGVTRNGNFEGRTILHMDPGARLSDEERKTIRKAKSILYKRRLERPRPGTDTKVLTSWNGLAISALAYAGSAFGDASYLESASAAADFVLSEVSMEGKLLRRYAGREASLEGTLEDYSFFLQGLLDLFEATSDPKWLKEGKRLALIMIDDYEDRKKGGFYLSLRPEPVRLKEGYDGPTPSGNSIAASVLVRLGELTGDEAFRKSAEGVFRHFSGDLDRQPSGHACMLSALDLFLNGMKEVVITAKTPGDARKMRDEVLRMFAPEKVLMVAVERNFAELSGLTTLLEGREPGPKARAFVCQNFTCKLPAESVEVLRAQLGRAGG